MPGVGPAWGRGHLVGVRLRFQALSSPSGLAFDCLEQLGDGMRALGLLSDACLAGGRGGYWFGVKT